MTKYAEFHEHKLEILNRPRKGRGGGIKFIFNPQVLKLTVNNVRKYSSFEVSEALLQGCSELIRLCVVYRSTQNVHVSDMIEVKNVSVIHDTGTTSDHYLVTFQMSLDVGTLDKPKCCTKTIREISKIDIENFKDKILSGLPNLSDEEDVNTLVLHLNHSLSTLLDEFAPEKIIKIKNNNHSVWWDSKCDEARRERRRAERKYKKDSKNNQYYQSIKSTKKSK